AATPFLLGEEVVVRVDDEQCGRVLLVDGGRYGGLLRTLDRQRRGAQRLSARRRRRRPGGRRRPWRPLRKDSGLGDAPRRRVVGAGRRAKYPHCPGCYCSAERDHFGMPTYPRPSCAGTMAICGKRVAIALNRSIDCSTATGSSPIILLASHGRGSRSTRPWSSQTRSPTNA